MISNRNGFIRFFNQFRSFPGESRSPGGDITVHAILVAPVLSGMAMNGGDPAAQIKPDKIWRIWRPRRRSVPPLYDAVEREQRLEDRRQLPQPNHVGPVGGRAVGVLVRLHEDRGDA